MNAESFDVTRDDSTYLALGHGVHHCLGDRLAQLEGLIAFTALLGRDPGDALAVPPSALRCNHGNGLPLPAAPNPVILLDLCRIRAERSG